MIISKETETVLLSASTTLNILKEDTDVRDKISRFGYLDTHLDNTIALHKDLEDFYRAMLEIRSEQTKLGVEQTKIFNQCYERYSYYFDIVKSIFAGDRSILKELGLTQMRVGHLSISRFLNRAFVFYNTLTRKTALMDKVTEVIGIPADMFVEEKDAIGQLELIYREHQRIKGEAQRMTFDRDEKLANLKQEMKRLKYLLKLALHGENPQTLERLGIFVRNKRNSKKSVTEPVTEPTEEPVTEPSTEPDGNGND